MRLSRRSFPSKGGWMGEKKVGGEEGAVVDGKKGGREIPERKR